MLREKEIIKILRDVNYWMLGSDLAKIFSVSDRTIRKDIADIKENFGNELIISSKKKGYRLNVQFLSSINLDTDTIHSNQNLRILVIIKELIINNNMDINSLASNLFVSPQTIENYINIIRKEIKLMNLGGVKLIKKKGIVQLKTSDINKNYLLYDIARSLKKGIKLYEFEDVFENTNILYIYSVMRETSIKYNLESRYVSLRKLTIDIAIMMEKKSISCNYKTCKHSDLIAEDILNKIKSDKKKLDKNLVIYISYKMYMILGLQKIENKKLGNFNDEISLKMKKALTEIGNNVNINFFKDQILVEKLISHIIIGKKRKEFGFNTQNPLMDNLKNECHFVFSLALIIAKKSSIEFDKEDISYMVTYLLIIMNDNQKWHDMEVFNIAIIVSEGIANLEYITNQIKLMNECNNYTYEKFLNLKDVRNIEEYNLLISTSNTISSYENGLAIDKSFSYLDRLKIISSIRERKFEKNFLSFDKYVLNFLNDDFLINSSMSEKKEIILKKMTNKLVNEGYVTEDFYQKILDKDKFITSRLSNGIAIPHDYGYFSKKTIIYIYINKNGIYWNDNKKVSVIILIAISKKDIANFVKCSSMLNKILLSPKFKDSLLASYSIENLKKEFKNFLIT